MVAVCAMAMITGAVVAMADVAVTTNGAVVKAMVPARFLFLTPKSCRAVDVVASVVRAMAVLRAAKVGAVRLGAGTKVQTPSRYRRLNPTQACVRALAANGCAAARVVAIVSLRLKRQ